MNQIKKGVSDAKNSEETTEIKKEKTSGLDIKSLLIGILGASTLALLIAVIAISANKQSQEEVSDATSMQEAVADSYIETKLEPADAKAAASEVLTVIEAVRDNNGYIHVYTDEETYDTYIYNKNGEVFGVGSDSNNMTVFRNDGKAIRFTDTIAISEDLDILELTINSLNAIDGKDIEMYQAVSEAIDVETYVGYKELYAVFDTYEDIRKLYSSVSEEYADAMIESIKSAFHEGVVPTFKIYYMISDGGGLTVACHLEENGETYLNWYYDGYLLIYDWELPEEWYTYDFSDSQVSENMLTELAGSLEELLMKYAEENEVTVTEQGETVEEAGENTDETTENSEGNVSVTTNENGEKVYTYEGQLDLSELPTITEEEAAAILERAESANSEEVESSKENTEATE